ncbi:MAG: MerC domain-containing protein [Planctomycetaceae bacterium]|nr:MerC domain-containing protein [Planctomycetaceae bacterium]MBT6642353.1 MerC domain-containing protein [Planctomycetaceae bacterium]MBT7728768.1 MerC domain-containing protein [Planctomycetaceae bacterium]
MSLSQQSTTETSLKNSWLTWADWTGLAASIACGIHCAAMPLLLTYLPSFGLSWLAHEGFHQWMTLLCFIFAASAFIPGWRKHKSLVPAFSGLVGITLLSLSAFVFGDECCAAATGSQLVQNGACTDAACTDAACTDAACSEGKTGQATGIRKSFQFASFTNWLSPLGGLFLVIGHIANHRKNCTCSGGHCCLEGDQALQHINDLKDIDG